MTLLYGILGILIIGILIIGYLWIDTYHSLCKSFINGFWAAPLNFCTAAGIKSASIYIYDKKMYIYIDADDRVLINKAIDFDFTIPITESPCCDTLEFSITSDEELDPLPQELSCRLQISKGYMAFFKDDKIHLSLYKDNKASNDVV